MVGKSFFIVTDKNLFSRTAPVRVRHRKVLRFIAAHGHDGCRAGARAPNGTSLQLGQVTVIGGVLYINSAPGSAACARSSPRQAAAGGVAV